MQLLIGRLEIWAVKCRAAAHAEIFMFDLLAGSSNTNDQSRGYGNNNQGFGSNQNNRNWNSMGSQGNWNSGDQGNWNSGGGWGDWSGPRGNNRRGADNGSHIPPFPSAWQMGNQSQPPLPPGGSNRNDNWGGNQWNQVNQTFTSFLPLLLDSGFLHH